MAVYHLPGFYEPFNVISHLGAAGVFVALGVPLVRRHVSDRFRASLLGVFVFATVFMLSMSGVYHMLDEFGDGAAVLFRLDKAAIFVLIAGTFTPVHGMLFRGWLRWAGIAVIWAAAATGITLVTIFFDHMPRGLTTTLYLTLGWIAAFSVITLWRTHGFRYIGPAVAGGVSYSVGAILLGMEWPTIIPRVIGPHEVWHIAVIAGMAFFWHFVSRLAREERTAAYERLVIGA